MSGGILKKVLAVAVVAAVTVLAVKYALPLLLPFIIAWGVAFCLQPPVRLLAKRFGGNRRLSAGLAVTLCVLGIGVVSFLLIGRLISELGGFLSVIGSSAEGGLDGFFERIEVLAERIPFLSSIGGDLSELLKESLRGMLSELTSSIPSLVGDLLAMLPSFILFVVILIMASYYFAADYDGLTERLTSLMPERARGALERFKERMASAGVQYLRSCLLLALITFVELTVGFLTLGVPYAVSLALVIALVDMLPILGAGTVLIPWAIWEWVSGNGYYAVGILIIFAVVTVVRRFSEPRIISSEIGLSPITTLLSMYIGFRFFGLGGLFLAPLVAVLVLNALPDELAEKLGLSIKTEKGGARSRRNSGTAKEP